MGRSFKNRLYQGFPLGWFKVSPFGPSGEFPFRDIPLKFLAFLGRGPISFLLFVLPVESPGTRGVSLVTPCNLT